MSCLCFHTSDVTLISSTSFPGILVFRIFSPVQTIMAYSNTTFASGDTFIPARYISILFASILFLSIFPATYLVDRAGRKILLLVSTLGCAVFSLVSCAYYYVREHQNTPLPIHYSYVNFVSICCIGVFFNLGLGPLYNPLTCEYFPSNTRALSGAVLAFSSASIQLIGYKLFYIMHVSFGMYSNFLLSCVICSLGVVWIYFFILETKGKSFAEIQVIFGKPSRQQTDLWQELFVAEFRNKQAISMYQRLTWRMYRLYIYTYKLLCSICTK